MSDLAQIWRTLSEVDCTAHVKQKNKLSYLPWAWAWGILMEHYPDASFDFLPEKTLPNGTTECCCVVTIQGHSRHMWLPVMDYRNESIENPTTRQISDSRMRCLVKCLALFGLGHSLYAGEDIPDGDAVMERLLKHNNAVREHWSSIGFIKDCLANQEWHAAYEARCEIPDEDWEALWVATTKGGIWTTQERALFKSNEWNDARRAYHGLESE